MGFAVPGRRGAELARQPGVRPVLADGVFGVCRGSLGLVTEQTGSWQRQVRHGLARAICRGALGVHPLDDPIHRIRAKLQGIHTDRRRVAGLPVGIGYGGGDIPGLPLGVAIGEFLRDSQAELSGGVIEDIGYQRAKVSRDRTGQLPFLPANARAVLALHGITFGGNQLSIRRCAGGVIHKPGGIGRAVPAGAVHSGICAGAQVKHSLGVIGNQIRGDNPNHLN